MAHQTTGAQQNRRDPCQQGSDVGRVIQRPRQPRAQQERSAQQSTHDLDANAAGGLLNLEIFPHIVLSHASKTLLSLPRWGGLKTNDG